MAEKKARMCDNIMMRHLVLEVASGSEESITDEESWISQHCEWSDLEVERQHKAAEESDEHDESNEHKEY